MQISKGTNRTVIAFPRIAIAVKIPNIRVWQAVTYFFTYIRYGKKGHAYLIKWFTYEVEVQYGFKWLIFRGIEDNRNERNFYSLTKNQLLQPTYFSLFGFMNIQKYGESVEVNNGSLLQHFMKITDGEAMKDGHHFADWRNFCFEDSKIKFLDYGSLKTQELIEKWGEKITSDFNFEEASKK